MLYLQLYSELSQGLLKDRHENSSKILKVFSVSKFAKTAIKLFVAMPNIVSYIRIFSSISSFLSPGQAFEHYYSQISKKTES